MAYFFFLPSTKFRHLHCLREEAKHEGDTHWYSVSTHNSLIALCQFSCIKQKNCGQQEIIAHDYDVMIGALPTEASTCTELTDLHFLRKKNSLKVKKI